MNQKYLFILAVFLALLLATSTIAGVNAFDPGGPPGRGGVPTSPSPNWEMINFGPNGGNYNPQNSINRDNINFLELKWMWPWPPAAGVAEDLGRSGGEGTQTPALIVDGIIYSGDNLNGVVALDAASGSLLYRTNPEWDQETQSAAFPHVNALSTHTHAIYYYRDLGILIPQVKAGQIVAFDAQTGEVAWIINELAGTEQEAIAWGSQSRYSIATHPPAIIDNILVVPVTGQSGGGGRTFVAAYDISNPQPVMGKERRIWQTFMQPPSGAPGGPPVDTEWALRECDKGWFFSEPEFRETGRLAVSCNEVLDACRECLLNDWINPLPNEPTFGRVHTASAISNVWGHYPVDFETGIVYMGFGDIGPYMNASARPGPNLYGSGVVALDARTGEFVWWFASNPHDLWDWDCSWGGKLGQVAGRTAYFKACKNGFLYALDAATGEPLWIFDPPSLQRCGEFCLQLDPKSLDDMQRPWANYPAADTWYMNPNLAGAIESDFAYDGDHVYVVTYNAPLLINPVPLRDVGNTFSGTPGAGPSNSTLYAVNANTGEIVWEHFFTSSGFRGGIIVSGGMVIVPHPDGQIYFFNSDTGELLRKINIGSALFVQPTIGADADGDFMLLIQTTTSPFIGGFIGAAPHSPGVAGALMAFNLPDVLPEPEVVEIVREVPGPVVEVVVEVPGPEREVIVEVPGEDRIVEVIVEVPVEVPGPERIVEVPVEVVVQTISPISYVAIGLGVVLVVIAGVLFTRRRGT